MKSIDLKTILILLAHALVIWGLCAAVIGIGMAITTKNNALIIHAIAAPLISIAITSIYYMKFAYTTPLLTAVVFILVVIFLDTFLVAMIINKSFDMFTSFIGTWLPFILIFSASYITGLLWTKIKG